MELSPELREESHPRFTNSFAGHNCLQVENFLELFHITTHLRGVMSIDNK